MKKTILLLVVISCLCCKQTAKDTSTVVQNEKAEVSRADFTMVFASCNDQNMEQPLWKPILEHQPDLFVWGGDNVYADTEDMEKMKSDYNMVRSNPEYQQLMANTTITGTWDDHDYGINDGGVEWEKKKEAQQLFLDFIDVPANDIRRNREGVYTSEIYTTEEGSIKLLLLDTRYFRSGLKKSEVEGMRYEAWKESDGGTILGEEQWNWLSLELAKDEADFTIIVSSIQFLNDKHGWEKWGNHPSEVTKMYEVLTAAKARNIFVLSGDRHMAEFSVKEVPALGYPLVDFTTSGLTKTYPDTKLEANPFRKGRTVQELNFGLLQFDFKNKKVTMEIRGKDNIVFETLVQQY